MNNDKRGKDLHPTVLASNVAISNVTRGHEFKSSRG